MTWRFDLGQKIARLGNKLSLPEMGISERIGGYIPTHDYQTGWSTQVKAAVSTPKVTQPVSGGYSTISDAPVGSGIWAMNQPAPDTTTNETSTPYGPTTTPFEVPPLTDVYTPNYTSFRGKQYDLNDPTQKTAYLNDAYGVKYAEGQNQYNEATTGINQDITNLNTNKTDWLTDWQNQYDTLGKNYQGKIAGIGNYYSGLGDIYQSSQGVREQGATDTFNAATDTANREKTNTLTNFDQTTQDLNKEKSSYGDWWTNYQQQLADEKANTQFADEAAKLDATRTAYTPIEKMAAISGDVGSLGLPVGSPAYNQAVAGAANRRGFSTDNPDLTGQTAKVVNKYYSLVDQTGDPSQAINSLTSAERQILSQLGL